MTKRHLRDLELALEHAKWRIIEKQDRNSWQDPAFWIAARPDGSYQFRISFASNPDLDAQTLQDAYCAEADVAGRPSAYFALGSSWPKNLKKLIEAINSAELNSIENTND